MVVGKIQSECIFNSATMKKANARVRLLNLFAFVFFCCYRCEKEFNNLACKMKKLLVAHASPEINKKVKKALNKLLKQLLKLMLLLETSKLRSFVFYFEQKDELAKVIRINEFSLAVCQPRFISIFARLY